MTRREMSHLDGELSEYLETMVEGLGRSERRRALELYLTGLLLDGERKSVEPMAARLVEDEAEAGAMRQRLRQCVAVSDWSDSEVRRRLARKLDEELPEVEAFVIDDTGFAKKGEHSVGVARQYSGTLGRTDNCQVAVSLPLAGEKGSGCIGMRLYLPEEWARDGERRAEAGVPMEVRFERKWEIALGQLEQALAWGVRPHVALADAGYGDAREFREGVRRLGLHYLMGVQGSHKVWPPGAQPQQPPKVAGRNGRPRTRYQAAGVEPWSMAQLALQLPEEDWHTVHWREGSRGAQSSRFAAVRVRSAVRHVHGVAPGPEEWLLVEWPRGEEAPTKYALCSLPADTSRKKLVRLWKLRWRVERDYQEMKQEVGLDHFEGRSWRGFHHHATLCAVAHAFLALRRALFPPEDDALDAASGAQALAAPASTPHRLLPALPASRRQPGPSSRPLSYVTK